MHGASLPGGQLHTNCWPVWHCRLIPESLSTFELDLGNGVISGTANTDTSRVGMQCSKQISSLHSLLVSLEIPQSVWTISSAACVSVVHVFYVYILVSALVQMLDSFALVYNWTIEPNSRTGYTSEWAASNSSSCQHYLSSALIVERSGNACVFFLDVVVSCVASGLATNYHVLSSSYSEVYSLMGWEWGHGKQQVWQSNDIYHWKGPKRLA